MMPDIDVSITDVKGQTISFSNIEALIEFAKTEAEYWKESNDLICTIPNISVNAYISVNAIWQQIYDALVSWRGNYEQWGKDESVRNIIGQTQQLNGRWLWSGHPFSKIWVDSYKLSQSTGDAFIAAILTNSFNSRAGFDHLKGAILAYEYLLQDETGLTERRHAEEESMSRLRSQLVDKKNELIGGVSSFQAEINAWKEETQNGFSAWHSSFEETLNRSESGRVSLFNGSLEGWKSDIARLEHTYQEKLRLAAPAAYWQKRAKSLSFQGGFWAVLLVLSSVILTVGAGVFFWGWLHKEPIPFGPQSLQGVALFGATAAAAVFLIKTLSKLTFSAFHLQRDAEEKEQLTHLYLSLINEGAMDSSSRDIVLQALFSRAETGLLAGDSGPTMPGVDSLANMARTSGTGR